MLGTLNEDGVYNFKHLASVIRLQIPTLPKTTTKVVFETLNTPITGTYTADVTAETPTLEALEETGGQSVTVNFSEALTEDITDARILIPVPAGTLTGGFRISVYEGTTLYSSYTTYKDKTAARNKLMLYTLYPNTEAATTDDGGVIAFTWTTGTADDDNYQFIYNADTNWYFSNIATGTYQKDTYNNNYNIKFKAKADHTLHIPANKEVTKITFVGYSNGSSDLNFTFNNTEYLLHKKGTTTTHTIVLANPIEGGESGSTVSFKTGSTQTDLSIYVTYKNSATE
jgi:hypothetical protein